jgi:hypothetical protein
MALDLYLKTTKGLYTSMQKLSQSVIIQAMDPKMIWNKHEEKADKKIILSDQSLLQSKDMKRAPSRRHYSVHHWIFGRFNVPLL